MNEQIKEQLRQAANHMDFYRVNYDAIWKIIELGRKNAKYFNLTLGDEIISGVCIKLEQLIKEHNDK